MATRHPVLLWASVAGLLLGCEGDPVGMGQAPAGGASATGGATAGGTGTGSTGAGGTATGSTGTGNTGTGNTGTDTGGTGSGGTGSGGAGSGGTGSTDPGGTGLVPHSGGYGGSVVSCATPRCGLQALVDDADDGTVIEIGPDGVFDNVVVTGKELVFDCGHAGALRVWTCFDDAEPALTAGPDADVTVDGCVFQGCQGGRTATSRSGAIALDRAARLVVRNSVFRNNEAYRGAALSTWPDGNAVSAAAYVLFENNRVHDNHTTDAGAIYLAGAMDIDLVNSLFYYNVADAFAPAVWLEGQARSRVRFTKNVVYTNIGATGAALETQTGEGPLINSSIVLGNTGAGGQLAASWAAAYSQLTGVAPFVAPLSADYRLVAGSAAVDAGDPALPLDLDGTRADLGPYLDRLPTEP